MLSGCGYQYVGSLCVCALSFPWYSKMLDIVRKIAEEVSGTGVRPDVVVANEVVVRSVIRALLNGKSLGYTLNVHKSSVLDGEVRYSLSIEEPGVAMSVQNMRESCAMNALEGMMSHPEGREHFRRYIFSICAFMPENVDALVRTLGSSSRTPQLRVAVDGICRFLGRNARNITREFSWQKAYHVCSDQLLIAAMNTMSNRELASVAYAVYTSPACRSITNVRNELKSYISSDYVMEDSASSFAKRLLLLSNFNPELSAYYKIRKSIDKRKTASTLVVRPKGVLKVLEDERTWAHMVNGRVSGYIREHAQVNAEMLLLICMLLDKPIDITTDNVGALLLDDGKVAYSFSAEFSFPLVDIKPFYKDLKGGVQGTEDGKKLVGLLLQDYHIRQRCSFNVCYTRLADEIRRLSNEMARDSETSAPSGGQNGGLRARIARNVMQAVCPAGNASAVVIQCSWDLASRIADRIKFLREFVDSEDYPALVEFIMHSNHVDNQADFARYLERKRKADKLYVRTEQCKHAKDGD